MEPTAVAAVARAVSDNVERVVVGKRFEVQLVLVAPLRTQHVEQHRGEAEDGVHLLAGRGRQLGRQGVVRAKDQPVAVDEHQGWSGIGRFG